MSLPPLVLQGILPQSTIVPKEGNLFIPYFTRLYEQIATAVNARDYRYFDMAISTTAQNIPNVANFGAYLICVSGVDSTLPTITASLCKADATAMGSVVVLGSQVGTGAWAGNALSITTTATNFQIAHDASGLVGNFNLRIIGTQ